ncbi:GDYXXLXY domain-containing protein [Fischerella sp. JS2]|uniref:GDYXXLXY domain-containing protein n=1 Tax=Fischerella sp. JS2 TaxID=2597771 RepID=UPI0028EAF0D9|nr:GDYXXLXY domain-containing protein [Fischerella sp. JS2]
MKLNSPETKQSSSFINKNSFPNYLIPHQPNITKAISTWWFIITLIIQTLLIVMIPLPALVTHITGKTVILKAVPVDPYNLLLGYSMTLDYEISQINTLQKLPGWQQLMQQKTYWHNGMNLYVILQQQKSESKNMPAPWKPIGITSKRPSSLPNNQVALKGHYSHASVHFGLDTYYIPEEQQQQINQDLFHAQQARQEKAQPIVVEIKVNPQGKAVPISMWVSNTSKQGKTSHNYRF